MKCHSLLMLVGAWTVGLAPAFSAAANGVNYRGIDTSRTGDYASHDPRHGSQGRHTHRPRNHRHDSGGPRIRVQIQLPQTIEMHETIHTTVIGSDPAFVRREGVIDSGRVYILPPVQPIIYVPTGSSQIHPGMNNTPVFATPSGSSSRDQRYDEWNQRERWGNPDQR